MRTLAHLALLLAAMIATAAPAFAGEHHEPRIHVLLAGETLNPRTGLGVRSNMDGFAKLFSEIQALTNLDVTVQEIKGKDFNCANISKGIEKLRSASDDDVVVFFYFGMRASVSGDQCRPDPAALGEIISDLRDQSDARLILTFVDRCDHAVSDAPDLQRITKVSPDIKDNVLRQAFYQLLMEHKGILLMSSSSPGEKAYCNNSGRGFFSTQLLSAIYRRISAKGSSVAWDDIVADAGSPISIPSASGTLIQHPQYELQLDSSSKR